jgi:hypothetical protein
LVAKSIPTNLQVPSDRPGLVAFFNNAFARTFENAGLPRSATRIDLVYSSDLLASRRRWPSGDDGLPAWLAEKDPVGEGYSRRLVPLCIEQRLDVELPHLMRPKNHLYVALVDDLDASFSLACSRAPALKNWLVTQTFLRVTSGRRLAYAACPVTTSLIAKGEKEDASPRS